MNLGMSWSFWPAERADSTVIPETPDTTYTRRVAQRVAGSWVHWRANMVEPPDNRYAGPWLQNTAPIANQSSAGGYPLSMPMGGLQRASQAQAIQQAMIQSVQNKLPGRG